MADFEECLEQFTIDHDLSPLSAMRRAGLRADDFPAAFRCAEVDRRRAAPLDNAGGLLWVMDREVIADRDWLAEIHVTDATRLRPGDSVTVARLGPRRAAERRRARWRASSWRQASCAATGTWRRQSDCARKPRHRTHGKAATKAITSTTPTAGIRAGFGLCCECWMDW